MHPVNEEGGRCTLHPPSLNPPLIVSTAITRIAVITHCSLKRLYIV